MPFVHRLEPKAEPFSTDGCLVIQSDRVLARTEADSGVTLPALGELMAWANSNASHAPLHVGLFNHQPLWLRTVDNADAMPPAGWEWHETRALLGALTPAQMHAVSCARELNWWQTRSRFCGCCGSPTVDVINERAKKCPACHALFYPGASPAIIVAVTRGDQLLLAHNRNFRAGMFSLLAGFVDPGETLEQAALREVREEVGIEIDALRYITSQPWPFPNSLMLGFRANHVSGELIVDNDEIEQAGWFSRDGLPDIPRVGTVARLLIDNWLSE